MEGRRGWQRGGAPAGTRGLCSERQPPVRQVTQGSFFRRHRWWTWCPVTPSLLHHHTPPMTGPGPAPAWARRQPFYPTITTRRPPCSSNPCNSPSSSSSSNLNSLSRYCSVGRCPPPWGAPAMSWLETLAAPLSSAALLALRSATVATWLLSPQVPPDQVQQPDPRPPPPLSSPLAPSHPPGTVPRTPPLQTMYPYPNRSPPRAHANPPCR